MQHDFECSACKKGFNSLEALSWHVSECDQRRKQRKSEERQDKINLILGFVLVLTGICTLAGYFLWITTTEKIFSTFGLISMGVFNVALWTVIFRKRMFGSFR
jgi:hypothetical protein